MTVEEKRERARTLAAAAGISLDETEVAAMAEFICGLIDTIDEAAKNFGAETPEPLMRPGSPR